MLNYRLKRLELKLNLLNSNSSNSNHHHNEENLLCVTLSPKPWTSPLASPSFCNSLIFFCLM